MEGLKDFEEAVAAQGAVVRTKKEAGEDLTEALAQLGVVKANLKAAIDKQLPTVEVNSELYHALRDKLLPLLTDKSAKKKLQKDIKRAKKASAATGSAAAPAAAGAKKKAASGGGGGGAASSAGAGKKKKKQKQKQPKQPRPVPEVCRSVLVVQASDLADGNAQMCLAAAALAEDPSTINVCVVANAPEHEQFPVSYTHLTLPTKRIV